MSASGTMKRAGRTTLTKAVLLPGRPLAGDPAAGPTPSAHDATQAAVAVRAICCSGGGVRAAAFSLGGLQFLNQASENAGTFYGNADLVTSVSGGGYIAGSYATVAHNLDPAGRPHVYEPGSPEDNRLRAHSRYLADSKTQLTISLLGILFGLTMNLAAILGAAFVVSKIVGWLLGAHGLDVLRLAPGDQGWTIHYPHGLVLSLLATAGCGVAIYVVYRIVDTYRPLGEVGTKRWCVAAIYLLAAALAATALLVVVPWLLYVLNRAPGEVAQVGTGVQTGTITGTATAVAAIVLHVVRTYTPKPGSAGNAVSAAVSSRTRPLATRIGNLLLPWLGSALIVVLLLVAMLTWVSDMARGADQTRQWLTAVAWASFLLIWQAITDGNRTSLHRYYTQRLASAFGVTRGGVDLDPPEQRLSGYRTSADKPELVVCGAVNTDQPGGAPSGRNCAPFTFSAHYCGLSSGTMFQGEPDEAGFDLAARERGGPDRRAWERRVGSIGSPVALSIPTAQFERCANGLTLMDMIAVSGAAVSPAMGRMSRPSLRLLLGVADVRLGMWLPNPLHPQPAARCRESWWTRLVRQLHQPALPALAREIVGGLTLHGRWVYVTDGGHYENLGLVEALRRGATEIVVFDASGDTPFTLAAFGEAVETARADLGVEISLVNPDALREVGTTGRTNSLAATAIATYANGVAATIYLCKAARVDAVPPDVHAWQDAHSNFPNDSTLDQFYGDREFEAYRCLGYEAARQALALREAAQRSTTKPQRRAGAPRFPASPHALRPPRRMDVATPAHPELVEPVAAAG